MKQLTYVEPSHIIDNLYFVGSKEASCHFFATEEGLMLIDTGYAHSLDGILSGIKALGFDPGDIKKIVHSHGHGDHSDATAGLLALVPEAKTYLNFSDIKYIKGFTPDFDIKDGDIIELGSTRIRCLHTPGHTEGTTSFFWDATEDGKTFKCGMFGGMGVNQVRKSYLHRCNASYTNRGLFYRSLERLKKECVDVIIGNHTRNNNTVGKIAAKKISASNPFIVSNTEWRDMINRVEKGLDKVIEEENKLFFVTYAHRGASHYCPENTMLSFYQGIYQGANGIETDVHRTKDGILVLFHDDTLERVCGVEGRVEDMTFEELRSLDVCTGGKADKIPSLDDFLYHFKDFPITFAIELKGEGCEKDTAEAIRKYGLESKTIVTSFNFSYIKNIKEYAPELRIGWLTKDAEDETLSKLLSIKGEQICPIGSAITPETVKKCHRLGLDVRAWGINLGNYKAVYDAGADGMTVNFPDLLLDYIKEKNS